MKLESEKAVTEILSGNGVLKSESRNVYKTFHRRDLGNFIQNSKATETDNQKSKYSFITLGLWKW